MEALYAALKSNNCKNKYIACLSSFEALPNNIFAYWLSTHVTNLMANAEKLSEVGESRQGITTSDNNRFVRMWQEVSFGKINFKCLNRNDAQLSNSKWFPLIKGGDYRKWYGNQVLIVDFKNDGEEIKKLVLQKYPYLDSPDFVVKNQDYYFQAGITWNDVSTGFFCARLVSNGFIFADAGPMYFSQVSSEALLGYFNSNTFQLLANAVCQGLHYSTGDIPLIPFIEFDSSKTINIVSLLKKISKRDWDSFETSWDFFRHPLLVTLHSDDYDDGTVNDLVAEVQQSIHDGTSYKLSDLYEEYKEAANEDFDLLKQNEEDLNRIFIDIYGLQDELKPEEDDSMVSVHKIFDDKSEIPESMKGTNSYALTKADVVKSLISYAVGCMFGRYSLDVGGLVYAGGEWDESKYVTFKPDNDNVIPVLDGDYFDDDITERFYKFLIAAYGKDTFQENLRFIENALGMKVKDYFVKGFFKDHCSTYKNRPIYWMFSSPKGTFSALMYLHRYDRNTIQSMRNDYLLPFRAKLVARREELSGKANDATGSVSAKEKLAATKQLDKLALQIKEIDDWERDVVYPQCASPVEIDLDDGVKVNYQKLGNVLRPIK